MDNQLTPLGSYDLFIKTGLQKYSINKEVVISFIKTLDLTPIGSQDLIDKVSKNKPILDDFTDFKNIN